MPDTFIDSNKLFFALCAGGFSAAGDWINTNKYFGTPQ